MSTDVERGRVRGRPRAFDEDAVLGALTELFARHGFEAASLADIVEAAGLNKSSLYNAFGSKDELFRRVLDRYIDERTGLLALATGGDGGLDDLIDLTDLIRAEALGDQGRMGCLAINTTAELGFANPAVADAVGRFRRRMEEAIRRPLERAADLGEIDRSLVDVYVDTVVASMTNISVAARGGAAEDELTRRVDSLRTLIGTWRR